MLLSFHFPVQTLSIALRNILDTIYNPSFKYHRFSRIHRATTERAIYRDVNEIVSHTCVEIITLRFDFEDSLKALTSPLHVCSFK